MPRGRKSILHGGARQDYALCVGSSCNTKETPARKLFVSFVNENDPSEPTYRPLCAGCESEERASYRKLGIKTADTSPALTKDTADKYNAWLENDLDLAEQHGPKPKGKTVTGILTKNMPINPVKNDSHGVQEMYHISRGNIHEGTTGGAVRGVVEKKKRLTPEQKQKELELEKTKFEETGGNWKPLKSGRLRKDAYSRLPIDPNRRPTASKGQDWKSPERINTVFNAKITAADPQGLAGMTHSMGLPDGKNTTLEGYLNHLQAAMTERAQFERKQRNARNGKKTK